MEELAKKIRAEIQSRGIIPFADFMEMALYCPVYGYYEKESDKIGAGGDFFTSPSVGPFFGQLLASQFCDWIECLETVPAVQPLTHTRPAGAPLYQLVEAGAHDGTLAGDILAWIQTHRPSLSNRLEYWIIEPSAIRRSRQERTLAPFAGKVRWAEPFSSEGSLMFHGVIFSNELLDALPVHRLGWDTRRRSWFEWGVGLNDDQFIWSRLPQVSPDAARLTPRLPDELLDVLPDGFTTEVSPTALDWWRKAANSLARGRLLAIDYGLEANEFFEPHRAQGTLRGYRNHRPATDILANPGEQDLTAHVNFSALREAGESCGLVTEPLQTQTQFLTRILARLSNPKNSASGLTQEQTRQFQTLTHPDHLGQAFRVLIQTRQKVET